MKKGLSVLLIAAALFGFYGGATSLTDILASKDYWEEQGEKSTADMNKLEDGLNQLKDNEKAYLDGQKQLADGEKQLADAEVQLEEGRATLAQGYADYAAAPAKLRAGEAALAAGEKDYAEGEQTLATAKDLLKQLNAGIAELNDEDEGYQAWKNGMLATRTDLSGTTSDPVQKVQYQYMYKIGQACTESNVLKDSNLKSTYESAAAALGDGKSAGSLNNAITAYVTGRTGVLFQGYLASHDLAPGDPTGDTSIIPGSYPNTMKKAQDNATNEIMGALAQDSIKGIMAIMTAGPSVVGENYKAINTAGSIAFNDAMTMGVADGLRKLPAGKAKMQNKLLPLLEKAGSNKDMIAVVESNGMKVPKLVRLLNGNDVEFEEGMDYVMGVAPLLRAKLTQAVHKGENDLAAGAAKLAAGRRELAQGYADYAAAPGKLADGEKQLADGEKQYADGKKQLEDGKKKLAEYEDGEQQVRDGLATLMATEADPGLESILDRRNGDDKFDDANGHLQLDEGLEAVDTGRGYQADSGELITKEITNRAVGTAAGLGAAALAVLAAILSFLKKSKGAAVSAVLAAVAGGIGAGVGLSAGEYYSDIAGSTIGNTPFIAAAVLAAVAAVFAIVHFTAKPEAK